MYERERERMNRGIIRKVNTNETKHIKHPVPGTWNMLDRSTGHTLRTTSLAGLYLPALMSQGSINLGRWTSGAAPSLHPGLASMLACWRRLPPTLGHTLCTSLRDNRALATHHQRWSLSLRPNLSEASLLTWAVPLQSLVITKNIIRYLFTPSNVLGSA